MLAGVGLLVACGLEFLAVAPNKAAVFSLSLFINDDGQALVGLEFDGVLQQGTDAQGAHRVVVDPTARLIDMAVSPSDTDSSGSQLYTATWMLDRAGLAVDGIDIHPPVIAGTSLSPLPLRAVSALRRFGDTTVTVERGNDLLLQLLAPAQAPIPTPRAQRWRLAITSQSQTVVDVEAVGPPPDTVVIPAPWLAAVANGSFEVELDAVQIVEAGSPEQGYIVALTVNTRLRWSVELLDAP